MKGVPNSDQLDFERVHFSYREEHGQLFHRAFVEHSYFWPLGEDLCFRKEHSIVINIRGDILPTGDRLNEAIVKKRHIFPECFENALMKYVEVIGEKEFKDRIGDGESVSIKDVNGYLGCREIDSDEVQEMWRRRGLHRVADLAQVSYDPSRESLGFLFCLDWEPYFSDHGFALLIEGGEVDYGLDQNFF